ncbi:ATP-binding protein [Bacillus sp. BAU-SS-2023]|nr:ATP-binding protein [Bacillus sp. BAU-SS-2023]
MLIKRVKIDGYKNVYNVNLELGNIIALVALNNYGKSNVLDGIRYANQFIKSTPDVKDSMMNYIHAIPINNITAKNNFIFEIEYYTESNGKNLMVDYSIEFNWPKNSDEHEDTIIEQNSSKIVKEVLRVKEDKKGQKYNIYINRSMDKNLYKSADTGRCDKNIQIEENNLILNKLNNYDDLYYIDIIRELNNLNFDVNSFLDTTDAFNISPIRFKNNNKYKLMKDGSNIEEIIYNLKHEDEQSYEYLKNCFIDLFPDIESMEPLMKSIKIESDNEINIPSDAPFMIMDNIYRIKVKEKNNNQYINFEMLSNGTKRVFLLLTSIILASKNNTPLIAFEELENCIHPALFKSLIDTIKNIVEEKKCRIILSSHSPILVNLINLENLYIGLPNEDGVAKFSRIKKSKTKTIENNSNERNIQKGNYIFELLSNQYIFGEDDICGISSMIEME